MFAGEKIADERFYLVPDSRAHSARMAVLACKLLEHLVITSQRHAIPGQTPGNLLERQAGNSRQFGRPQRSKRDKVIDSIDKLVTKMVPAGFYEMSTVTVRLRRPEPNCLLHRPSVTSDRRKDDERTPKTYLIPLPVREHAGVEQFHDRHQYFGVRLVEIVEQHHTVWMA